VAKATPIHLRKIKRQTTYSIHNIQIAHLTALRASTEEKRLEYLMMLQSTDLTPLALMQLLMDLPPLQHGDLTF